MKPDGINAGMTRELGWEKNAVSEGAREFVFDVATLGGLVETMVKRLNAHSMRVVGDAKMPVKRGLGMAPLFARGVCAGIIESSSGSARVMPAPRRNARRGMCFFVRNISFVFLTQFYALCKGP